jgi:protein-tyrosine-phosphatase
MAEGLLKKIAADSGLSLDIQSAGLQTFAGIPATAEAIEACKAKGVDISGHQSQPLSKSLILDRDLILTMTEKHKELILRKLPELAGKVELLSEFVGNGKVDVDDPIDQPLERYKAVLDQIEGYLMKAKDKFN